MKPGVVGGKIVDVAMDARPANRVDLDRAVSGLVRMAPMTARMDRNLRRDLKTLAKFIEVYCRHQHKRALKTHARLKTHDLDALMGRAVKLCPACRKLLAYTFVKRARCPLDPKPACKHCPSHCYHSRYRTDIRSVMKYSGRRLVLSGRLDYLWRMLS